MSDIVIHKFSYGEVGFDVEHSPGVGPYYVKHYASGVDESGFDSVDEAVDELEAIMELYEGAEVE